MVKLSKRIVSIIGAVSVSLFAVSTLASGKLDNDSRIIPGKKLRGDFSIRVLGSGGPIATAEGRASAGYLIYIDGKPRVLMDAGGGTFQRLAQSGADLRDLDTILISHLHVDHAGDLSAMIKTIYFHNNLARGSGKIGPLDGRTAPINIYGPGETAFPNGPGGKYPNGQLLFPSTEDYVHEHYAIGPTPLNPEAPLGTERYLTAFVNAISEVTLPDGTKTNVSKFAYTANSLNANWTIPTPELILDAPDGLRITALAVNHGPVPNVAFRVEYNGYSIVYTGDTSSRIITPTGSFVSPALIAFASDADLLIYDTAITNTLPTTPVFRALHTTPDDIGTVAAGANAQKLLLSHITPVTGPRIKEIKKAIRAQGYTGKINVAGDLKVYNLDK